MNETVDNCHRDTQNSQEECIWCRYSCWPWFDFIKSSLNLIPQMLNLV